MEATRNRNRRFRNGLSRIGLGLALAGATLLATPQAADACVYAKLVASINRLINIYLANPTPTNAVRICNKIRRLEDKLTGVPGKPVPAIPAGIMCSAGGGGGAGRGGGAGGGVGAGPVGVPGGSSLDTIVFVRNHRASTCTFMWTITPDPGNPAGFSVTPLTGSVMVPASSTVTVPISATIGGGASPGDVAFFDVEIIDTCNGLPLPSDLSRFSVTASAAISVVPNVPLVLAAQGVPFMTSWKVTNHSGAPISKSYALVPVGDPASVGTLNAGTPYDVRNVFDTSMTGGGTVNLNPGESTDIDWGPLELGEFCDPEMTNCCGLEIDGALTCVVIGNDDAGPDNPDTSFVDLVGTALGGGVQVQFQRGPDNFFVQVNTNPGQPIPQILDQIALDMLFQSEQVPGFHFMPMVDELGIGFLVSPTTQVFVQSFDPGLNWVPNDFLAGNAGENLLFLNGSDGGPDRTVDVVTGQSLTVDFQASSCGPANSPYWLYVWPGFPDPHPSLLDPGGQLIGLTALPTPFNPGANPQPIFCLRGGVPGIVCGAANEKPAPPEVPFSVTKAGGVGNPIVLTLQGFVFANKALSPTGISITNAVTLNVQ